MNPETSTICPKCGYERQETDSIIPDWQCPKCGVVYAKVRRAPEPAAPSLPVNGVIVRMVSGQDVLVSKIKLYDLRLIQQYQALEKSANHNMAGYSTGLGIWGGLETIAVGTMVNKVVEGAVSGTMRHQAAGQISEMVELSGKIREGGIFAPVSQIHNVQYPDPSFWGCPFDLDGKHIPLVSIPNNKYIFVEFDGAQRAIFWDKVEQYEVI